MSVVENADGSARLRVEAGNKAPEFMLANYEGKTISLSDYNSKIVAMDDNICQCDKIRIRKLLTGSARLKFNGRCFRLPV